METGESVDLRNLTEIDPSIKVVTWLRDREKQASRGRFDRHPANSRAVPGEDRLVTAGRMAVSNEINVILNDKGITDTGVLAEIARLGIRVQIGEFSISAKEESDEKVIEYWRKTWHSHAPREITLRFGQREALMKDSLSSKAYIELRRKLAAEPRGNEDLDLALRSLGRMSPRDIARAFRESIERGQNAVRKRQKREPQEEPKALRRGE